MQYLEREQKSENTSAGFSTTPRPRLSDMTKAVAVQVVMESGTVRVITAVSESLP